MKKFTYVLPLFILMSACAKNGSEVNFKDIPISKLSTNINLLNCKGMYDSAMSTSEEGSGSGDITDNSEEFDMTIGEEYITFVGTEFLITLNTDDFLIGARTYEETGLVEMLHLNKNNGIMIDSKTFTQWMGNSPAAFDTIFSCEEYSSTN